MELGIRAARRIVVALVGTTLVLVGVALLVLPGPGFLVMGVGLAALSTEFVWARRWLERVRQTVEKNGPWRDRGQSAATPTDADEVSRRCRGGGSASADPPNRD